jgi:broad specificity phosphatase PhoE
LFKRANGVTDTLLNQTGIAQANLQAENLKHVKFDTYFCSPQTRARQTCEIIYKGPIVFDNRLVEINCGEFEGKEETPETMKLLWQVIMSGDKSTESFKAFMKRGCDFCDILMENHKSKNILIVTHAANIRVIDCYFHDKPKDYNFLTPTPIKNGGLLTFEN